MNVTRRCREHKHLMLDGLNVEFANNRWIKIQFLVRASIIIEGSMTLVAIFKVTMPHLSPKLH